MTNQLMVHRGAAEVSREALVAIDAPAATNTWYPIRHGDVMDAVEDTLDDAGFAVSGSWLSVSNDNHRFFGVLDIRSTIVDGVNLAVGVRNSNDKSFPIGFCCGTAKRRSSSPSNATVQSTQSP